MRRTWTWTISCLLLAAIFVLGTTQAFSPSLRVNVIGINVMNHRSPSLTRTSYAAAGLNSKNDDNDDDQDNNNSFLLERWGRANVLAIRRDAILLAGIVLGRYLLYDFFVQQPDALQQVVWLTGTLSSAVVLICYWTVAGLLSKSFEGRPSSFSTTTTTTPMPVLLGQVMVNVVLSCPIWIATEHLLEFGPADIGGNSLETAIATGFTGLASAMILGRILIMAFEDDDPEQ